MAAPHSHALRQAVFSRIIGAKRMRDLNSVVHLRKKPHETGNADHPCRLGIETALAEIAAGKSRFRRIGGALAGEKEIQPVLAMEYRRSARKRLRSMCLQPGQLWSLLAGVQSRAGQPIKRRVTLAAANLLDQSSRT